MRDVTSYMPNGHPCPAVLTGDEVIVLLRLDAIAIKNPQASLDRLRGQGLNAVRIGKACRFLLSDITQFLEERPQS